MRKWSKWIISAGVVSSLAWGAVGLAVAAASDVPGGVIQSYEPTSLVKNDGTFWQWGTGRQSAPTQVYRLEDVKTFLGANFVMKKDGSVWYVYQSTADAPYQAFLVNGVSNLTSVHVGYNRSIIALDNKGNGYSVTLNGSEAKFDLVPGLEQIVAVTNFFEWDEKSTVFHWAFLKEDGSVWLSGDRLTELNSIASLKDVVTLSHNYALDKDGNVWSWPLFRTGGEKTGDVLTAQKVKGLSNIRSINSNGTTHLAIDGDGRLYFWGDTITGFSDGTTHHNQTTPISLTSIKNVKDAVIAERSLVVLTEDGSVLETSIELEKMPNNPSFKSLASGVTSIKSGNRHVIMQKTDGTLWGWGVNKNAELGYGDYEFMHETPVPVQLPISIHLNDELVALNNGVITRNSQAFIPLRSVFEKLGAKIDWDEKGKVATINRVDVTKPTLAISINFNTGETKLNNEIVKLANEPFGVNGVSYLPLRFISESLGAKVDWAQKTQDISITLK